MCPVAITVPAWRAASCPVERKGQLTNPGTLFASGDAAVLSRADHVEEVGLPTEAARREIILDTLKAIGGVRKNVHDLEADADRLAKISEGLDGRRIRKEIFVAVGSDIETAKDPNKLTKAMIEAAFRQALKTKKELTQ